MRDLPEKVGYEEYKLLTPFWGWVALVLFTAFVLGSGMFYHYFVGMGHKPRDWDFGDLPDAPGESVYSTMEPPARAEVPPILPPLPEAKPLKPAPEQGSGQP